MKKIFTLCLILCNLWCFSMHAQTPADSVTIAKANWNITQSSHGMNAKYVSFDNLYGGPQYISVVEITRPKSCEAAIAGQKEMITTSDYAEQNGAVTAINGSFFNGDGSSACYYRIQNNVIAQTSKTELKMRTNGALLIRKGKISFMPWSKEEEAAYNSKRYTVLASGPLLMKDGKVCDFSQCNKDFIETKHPRSAVVLTNDHRILLIAVDGRAPRQACGMSIDELAHFVRILGAKEALNLDGGGSTTLWFDGKVINHPTDNNKFDHEGERKVANVLYFK